MLRNFVAIVATIFASMLLLLIPHTANLGLYFLLSQFSLLVIIYWSIYESFYLRAWLLFALGLLFDLVTNEIMGLHSLIFGVTYYLIRRQGAILEEKKLIEQIVFIAWLVFIAQVIFFSVVNLFVIHINNFISFIFPAILVVLAWPCLKLGLDKYRSIVVINEN